MQKQIWNYFSPKYDLEKENLPTDKLIETNKILTSKFTSMKGQVLTSNLSQFSCMKGNVSIHKKVQDNTASSNRPITAQKIEIELTNEKQGRLTHANV